MRTKKPTGNSTGDKDVSIEFLGLLRPKGPWQLTAIYEQPKKQLFTQTFDNLDGAREFIKKHNGKANLYYTPNTLKSSFSKKPEKVDVAAAEWLWVDIDYNDPGKAAKGPPMTPEHMKAERERILELLSTRLPVGVPAPTAIVFTGGGFQALWRLDKPIRIDGEKARWEEYERYNRGLCDAFIADKCWNVERILRLPASTNFPDRKKRERGRVTCLTELVHFSAGTAYGLKDFRPAAATAAKPSVVPGAIDAGLVPRALRDLAELDEWNVPTLCREVIAQGHDPDEPTRFASRSEAMWHVVCELTRRTVPDDLILGIVSDGVWPVSAHVRAQKNPHQYALKQLNDAKAKVEAAAQDFLRTKSDDGPGRIRNLRHNVKVALNKLGVRLSFNAFSHQYIVAGAPGYDGEIQDETDAHLRGRIEKEFEGFDPGKEKYMEAVSDLARENTFHPVHDYLDGLAWDGTPRLDRWLIDYLGAEDTALNRAVGAIVLMAAVRRVRQPGCKFDEVMVFESEEGTGKSEVIKILAGQPEWFTDNLSLQDETKVIIENTAGKWLIEYGELEGLQKAETEAVKRMLSRQVDEARLAYGRRKSIRPRQWISIGTTNNDRYLKSTTGNRRFWPVKVGAIDLDALRRDRDLIWAEATLREAKPDASIRLDPSLYEAAKAAQQRRMVEPPNIDRLIEHLGTERRGWIAPTDVYRLLGYKDRDPNPGERQGIGQALRDLGFEQWGVRIGGTKRQVWWRGSKPHDKALQIEVTIDNAYRYVVVQPRDDDADGQPRLPSGDVSRALN